MLCINCHDNPGHKVNETSTVFTFMKLFLHWQAAARVFEVLQVKQAFDFSRLGATYPVIPTSLGREKLDLRERGAGGGGREMR